MAPFATALADEPSPEPPTAACDPLSKVPRLASTSAAQLPETLWATRRGWEAVVRFRVAEDGAPYQVTALFPKGQDDRAELERITTETFERYRFCKPGDFSTKTDWRAEVRFVYRRLDLTTGENEMYVQMFAPVYSRSDLNERRSGTARVAATYGADGRPTAVRIASTSGDPVLDDKSLASMASNQLVIHDPATVRFPMTFEVPFIYQIR